MFYELDEFFLSLPLLLLLIKRTHTHKAYIYIWSSAIWVVTICKNLSKFQPNLRFVTGNLQQNTAIYTHYVKSHALVVDFWFVCCCGCAAIVVVVFCLFVLCVGIRQYMQQIRPQSKLHISPHTLNSVKLASKLFSVLVSIEFSFSFLISGSSA